MNRSIMLRLAPAAIFAAALTGTVAAPAQAAPVVNLKVPITGTIPSDAGPLTVKGTIHLVIQPQDPIQPVDPVRVQTNLIQVSVSNTAVSCKATGAQKFTLATTTTPFIGFYPTDPIQPGDPVRPDACRTLGGLSVDFRLNVNDQGIVTGATAVALDPE
jgi:hypothetical protein